jgi:uncharacterized protein YndB with AHSA1/START domain
MRFQIDVRIPHPVEAVFGYLCDPRNRAEWQSATSRVEMLTEGPPQRGTRWRERAAFLGDVEFEIVRFEPNVVWAEYGTSRHGSGRVTLHFIAQGSETRVLTEADLRPQGLARLVSPLLRVLTPAAIRSDLRRAARVMGARG